MPNLSGKEPTISSQLNFPTGKEIDNHISKELCKMKHAFIADQFTKMITHIRFINFKNLDLNARIDFNFPITILVGQNGSGKSSVLHALYGSPDKTGEKGVEKYWFSTKTDPIGKEKPRFIYGYKSPDSSEIKEVLRQRMPREIKKDGDKRPNLDYWETAKPASQFGMNEERNPPLKINSRYYHFRNEVGAFERAFYNYQEKLPPGIKSRSIQDYIRLKSSFLKKVIDNNQVIKWGRKKTPQNEQVKTLSSNATGIANHILGKTYSINKLVKHRFFISWGQSATFNDNVNSYTDANAGSGEIGVLSFLHVLDSIQPNSLLLLDEPEISLHPGAQKLLIYHLIRFCLEKKIQIVISTHSPVIVSLFPSEAIKVFCRNHISGKYRVIQNCDPIEAFEEIGQTYQSSTIYVEDFVSQLIIEGCLKEAEIKGYKVKTHPGGANDMFASACIYSGNDDASVFFCFDGDIKPSQDFLDFNENDRPKRELCSKSLKAKIQKEFKAEPHISSSSGPSKEEEQIANYLRLISFLQKKCCFLPKTLPEDIIWCDAAAKKILIAHDYTELEADDLLEKISALSSKEKFLHFAEKVYGSREVRACQQSFFKIWLKKKNTDYDYVIKTLKGFK